MNTSEQSGSSAADEEQKTVDKPEQAHAPRAKVYVALAPEDGKPSTAQLMSQLGT